MLVYMYMYMYMHYIYIYMYLYIIKYVYIYIMYIYIYMCMYTYLSIYLSISLSLSIYIYISKDFLRASKDFLQSPASSSCTDFKARGLGSVNVTFFLASDPSFPHPHLWDGDPLKARSFGAARLRRSQVCIL